MITVYRIMCLANGKNYIGITGDLAHRLVIHFNDKRNQKEQTLFARAIRKYGKDNFQVFVLEEVDTWKFACQRERHYIQLYDTYKIRGYNMTLGGEGAFGLVHTECTREKMSASHIGKGCGPDNPMYGKPGVMLGKKWSNESRTKLSESCKGRIVWNKGKKCPQLSGDKNGFYGKKHSNETIKKIILANAGYTHSPETIKRMSDSHKQHVGWHHSDEAKLKMSESAKKHGSNAKGKKWSIESRLRASEAAKLRWQRDKSLTEVI